MKKRILSILMCIAMVFTVVYNPMLAEKASATCASGIMGNGTEGINININAAPFTTFATYNYGQNAYGKVGCAWYASARANQITGKGSTIWSGSSWWNNQYTYYGYGRGSEPRAKAIICYTDHVAIVEKVNGNTITISEGGSTYYSDASHGYCMIRNMSRSEVESSRGGDFLGYVYLNSSTSAGSSAQSGYVNLGDKFNASIFRTDEWVTLLSDTTTLGTGGRHARSVWTFERQSNGAYIITSWYDGKVLDVYGAEKSDGTKVWTCDRWVDSSGSNAAQEWYIYPVGSGYRFVPRLVPNKAMTCVHDSYGPKTPMNLQAWIDRGSQIFSIYKQTEVFPTGISTSNKTINEGESATLSYAISPSNTNSKYVGATFSSSNTNIVTVDENGVITGVAPGTATVTVTMAFNERKTAKATITVKEVVVDDPEEDGDGECTHRWDNGTIVTTPTCTSEGIRRYVCYNCGDWKTETLEKKPHNIVKDAAVAATCISTGLTEGEHCTNCDYKVAQQVVTNGDHRYGEWRTVKNATCEREGQQVRSCELCNDQNSRSIDKLPHEPGDWEVESKGTMSDEGLKISYCQNCGEECDYAEIAPIDVVKFSKATYVYDGKVKNPSVVVEDINGEVISTDNYTVKKLTARKNVGKHGYKITFKNEYKGTKTIYFKINPKATSITSKPTAAKKAFTVKWKKVSTQATGYQIMYATNKSFTKGKKTVTVKSYKTTSKKITKLSAKKTYYVKVRTYKTVNGTKYYSAWSAYKTVKTR